MAENKQELVDLRVLGLGLECGEESKEVRMALGV